MKTKIQLAHSKNKDRNAREFDGARALIIIHVVLALLLPFIFTQVGGCESKDGIKPLDLGAEIAPAEIEKAISEPLNSQSPDEIKVGEFFVYSDTQQIAVSGAGPATLIADTSQTVVDRQEKVNPDKSKEIDFVIIQHRQTYENGDVRKVATEIPVRVEIPPPASTAGSTSSTPSAGSLGTKPMIMIGPSEADDLTQSLKMRPIVTDVLRDPSPEALVRAVRTLSSENGDTTVNASAGDGTNERVTYHNLKTSVKYEKPPALVASQPNCLGIPNCEIKVHRVEFDMVFWEAGQPDRVHWEMAMSPDAPYLAAILDKCVTGLAGIGTGQSKILVKQCKPVLNFRYVAPN